MPSKALRDLETGVTEVDRLLEADPAPAGGMSPHPDVTRAVIRSAVVLLSSHFERYVRSVTAEAVAVINAVGPPRATLPEVLRLEHSRAAVDELVAQSWERRAGNLEDFVRSEGWLWQDLPAGALRAERILTWMKSPKPKGLMRLYRLWGIEDIFSRITRAGHTRSHFFLRLTELIEKRNNIAHGDFSVEATRNDVVAYQKTVRQFCERSDRVLTNVLKRRLGLGDVWARSGPSANDVSA